MTIIGDHPIRRPEDDVLGRAPVARSFANQVLSLDASEGVVIGVLGAWGAGKTSFINLARAELSQGGVTVLDFNPWMFSGAEQLVESFFIELAAQLKVRAGMAEIAQDLEAYGEAFSGLAWLPIIGPWIDRGRGAAKILSKILQRRKEGVSGRRAKLHEALAALDQPLMVVLDDIDRLSTAEIRDIFKLVRLTASFPNIVYVLAFDRVRVEGALTEEGVPGRDYLEKILEVAIDLPAVPSQLLSRQIFEATDAALSDIASRGPFDDQVWPDLFVEVIRPLVRNMRDVRRYAASIHGTVQALDGEIALADVLALEAVRVFLPDVFGQLHRSLDGLTAISEVTHGGQPEPPHVKAEVDSLIEAAAGHDEVVRAMIQRLFPAAQRHIGGSHYGADSKARWLRERRVAHEEILRLYLERVIGEGLRAFTDAERAWELMAEREALDGYLRSLDPDRLEDVISSLETYEDEFTPERVVPGTVVLLNLLPDLPERPQGMFDFGSRLVVSRVTYRLLRSLDTQVEVEAAVRAILPEVQSLSSKQEVISDIGYREGAGHKLVSEEAAAELERAWRSEVREAVVEDLVHERDLLRVLLIAKRDVAAAEPPLELADTPELTVAVLRAARTEVRSQMAGSRAVRRSPRLAWDALIELYGDEETLRNRFDSLKAMNPQGEEELLELVGRYLSGWRPDELGED